MPWGRHWGVPISHNALQHYPECHVADTGGTQPGPVGGTLPVQGTPSLAEYPPARSGWGYPCRVPLGRVPPQLGQHGGTLTGNPPPWARTGGTLPGDTQVGYPLAGYPGPGWGGTQVGYPPAGYPPARSGQVGEGYPVSTTEGILTTRQAVCLLHSCRRTFLFEKKH